LFYAPENPKKLVEAEQAFRDALKEEPSGAFLHQRLGLSLLRQSKDEEGKKELQIFLDMAPNAKDAATARAWIADPRRARLNFAPDFTVTTLRGETFTLSQFVGKVVLIDFWGTWCPPCRESIPELQDMFKKYPADNLVILSVSSDQEEDKWKKFVEEHKMEWHQYIDLDKHVLLAYNVHSFPTYVLVDREGVIRERISGLNPQETLGGRLKDPLKKALTAETAAR
jgi:peroxiredoxin